MLDLNQSYTAVQTGLGVLSLLSWLSLCMTLYLSLTTNSWEVSEGAKIRNRYNQVPHLTQDTNGKVTNSHLDTTNESQEVSPFPAGDQKAHINRRTQRHSKHKTEQKKWSLKALFSYGHNRSACASTQSNQCHCRVAPDQRISNKVIDRYSESTKADIICRANIWTLGNTKPLNSDSF